MADWLCDIVCDCVRAKRQPQLSTDKSLLYSQDVIYPQTWFGSTGEDEKEIPHTRQTIHPSPDPVPTGFEGAGAGRIVTFDTAQDLSVLIARIGEATGWPGAISVAIPQGATMTSIKIRTVGVCPGSGGSVIMKGAGPLPDLLFTGELSHHEALAAIERGSAVITLFHSNTERGYMHNDLPHKLADAVARDLGIYGKTPLESLFKVSEADRDPYGVVVLNQRSQ
jgi:putative NIF3 family GTP cyclohydrolase 1 type 2